MERGTSSHNLDLYNPASHGDPSKPIGALNADRLKKFQERYSNFDDQLQGGNFDHAERMFPDTATTWNGVLEDLGGVKELDPQLFYLPEVFTNENSIGFGATQRGGKLDSVQLPPWPDNPRDFIHKHLMALESEHVSVHLHEWIDHMIGSGVGMEIGWNDSANVGGSTVTGLARI
ncbi:Hypothetical predicted protein [Olea europaea subsp. europaea]|uniref:BEACH domain-containing protein n=1 Tax=Olea europaea subsp. europaea TaxID=158383 RepID=A0A8S0V0Z9_OLEEU|nr:Hypothetical predicted protein [Olea europaea subsp. europaea]